MTKLTSRAGIFDLGSLLILKRHKKREQPADMSESLNTINCLSELVDHLGI